MNVYTSAAIINLGILAMITAGMWITKSALPLFGLLFMVSASVSKERTKE